MDEEDPFDTLQNLETHYHASGYALGVADGARAGQIEGRVFGLEKGFEKFVAMGRLGGRAAVWDARLSATADAETTTPSAASLSGSERLAKHVRRLKVLTELETLSCQNEEESVDAFDERLREAGAKATLIQRIVGEDEGGEVGDGSLDGATTGKTAARRGVRVKKKDGGKTTGEMEDFAGLPGAMQRGAKGTDRSGTAT